MKIEYGYTISHTEIVSTRDLRALCKAVRLRIDEEALRDGPAELLEEWHEEDPMTHHVHVTRLYQRPPAAAGAD